MNGKKMNGIQALAGSSTGGMFEVLILKYKLMAKAKKVGEVVHYYNKLGVAIVDLQAPLAVGDPITFERGEDAFEQTVSSMQMDHENVERAGKGKSVGVKVERPVKEGATVLKAA